MWNDRRTTAFRLATERIPTRRENAGPHVRRLRSLAAGLPVFFWRGARGRGTLRRPGLRGTATGAQGHLPIDERRDLGGDLVLQRLRLVSGELLVARGLVDPCVGRVGERGDETVAALPVRRVRDVAEALSGRELRAEVGDRHTEVAPTGREQIAENALHVERWHRGGRPHRPLPVDERVHLGREPVAKGLR